ncbi:MAG TPA: hypothetical protein VHX86_17435 [Tepidisphaeraceae bacterium]|jgi:hypothetical protein|nr:hypothetical protein [Tepidisphaeraceae bacterium]
MVSQNPTEVVGHTDRGFVTQETIVATSTDLNDFGYPLPSFWGSVVAGTVVTLGIGALSECLMFGCHVGVTENGVLAFGAGAAVWMIVTTCIAYFVGGMLASRLSIGGGWMRGLTLWGFSLPLVLLIMAAISGGAGLAYPHIGHLTQQFASNAGLSNYTNGNIATNFVNAWIGFVCLACGLIFALIGSTASDGCASNNKTSQIGQ